MGRPDQAEAYSDAHTHSHSGSLPFAQHDAGGITLTRAFCNELSFSNFRRKHKSCCESFCFSRCFAFCDAVSG